MKPEEVPCGPVVAAACVIPEGVLFPGMMIAEAYTY